MSGVIVITFPPFITLHILHMILAATGKTISLSATLIVLIFLFSSGNECLSFDGLLVKLAEQHLREERVRLLTRGKVPGELLLGDQGAVSLSLNLLN